LENAALEQGLSLADLWPEGLNIRIYVLTLLILLLAGFASGVLYRAGAMAVLSFFSVGPIFVVGLIMGWGVWQCIAVCFTLLAALQLGFFTGAGLSVLQSTLRRRFAPRVQLREAPNRDTL
jgi:hypothetical protein